MMPKPSLSKLEIKKKYQALVKGKGLTPQKRGFEFEKLIYSILQNEKLEPRASYIPAGEQIDGSFFWQGQTFLFEAKWEKSPLPASSIYSFKGKLDGKFHTSSGIFISVSGYNKDVEDALKFGKSLNILLFDENDIPMIFNGEVSFIEMLKFKLREAGDTGSLKVSYKLKAKAEKISKTNLAFFNLEIGSKKSKITIQQRKALSDDLLIFIKDEENLPIIKKIIGPIKKHYLLSYRIALLNDIDNIRELPSLLNLYSDFNKTKAIIVIIDGPETREIKQIVKNVTEQFKQASIAIRPIFLFLNDNLKEKISKNKLKIEELKNEIAFEKLTTFIQQLTADYYGYDPETDIPDKVLKDRMQELEWDFKQKVIYAPSDYDKHSTDITTLEGLIEYLNEEMVQAVQGEMPMEWVKENYLDYTQEIREYLYQKNYIGKIKRIGWNTNDL